MYLLNALNNYKKDKKSALKCSEYEVLCRVHLTGILDLGAIYLQFWELPPDLEKNRYDVRAVYLKTFTSQEDIAKELSAKNKQYYVPGGLPNEIAILMTLFTRAHFVLSRVFRSYNTLLMMKFADELDVGYGDLDGKTLKLENIEPYFHMLEKLNLMENTDKKNSGRLGPFMLAARFYHLAFSLIHKDATVSYIFLVSAIESLLHDYDIDNAVLEDWNAKAAKLIKKEVKDDNKYKEIEQIIMSKSVRIKKRFISFIKSHLTEKFWSDPTRPKKKWLCFKDHADVEEYLSRIYDARSSALHEGNLFPPSFGKMNEERPIALGVRVGLKEWKEKELIPPVRAFERIIHHVLLEYLRRKSKII